MSKQVFNFQHSSCPNVLVVDDDPAIIRLVDHFLETEFGSEIRRFHACSTCEAQAIVERELIDLVVTDLEMGTPDGFQFLNWLKDWEPLIQVIVITGHETQDALRSAFALGANDFHVKPIQYSAFVQSVEFLLDRVERWQALLTKPTPDGPLFGVYPLLTGR